MKKITILIMMLISIAFGNALFGVTEQATKYLGKKYVWGGTNPNIGADCSGFTQYIFKKQNIQIPRTALAQSKIGQSVDISQLQKGDLLFFNTDKKRGIPITHVGIYMGDGNFIHAKGKDYGITISPVVEYKNSFKFAKRISTSPTVQNQVIRFALSLKEQAKRADTKVQTTINSLVVLNGKYYRLSELENLLKEKK